MQPPRVFLWNATDSRWEPSNPPLACVSLSDRTSDGICRVYRLDGGGVWQPSPDVADGDAVTGTAHDGTALAHVWDGSQWVPAEGDLTPTGILGEDAHWWWWDADVTLNGAFVDIVGDQVVTANYDCDLGQNLSGINGPTWVADWGDGLPAFNHVANSSVITTSAVTSEVGNILPDVEDFLFAGVVQRDLGADGTTRPNACLSKNASGTGLDAIRLFFSQTLNSWRAVWTTTGTGAGSKFTDPVLGGADGLWHSIVLRRTFNAGTGLYEMRVSLDGGAEDGPYTDFAQATFVGPIKRFILGQTWISAVAQSGTQLTDGANRETIIYRGTTTAAQALRLHTGMHARSIP